MTQIKSVRASTKDVAEVIDMIADATEREDEDVVMLACLGVATLIQDPDVSKERFLEIITSASEFIALQLATTGELVN